MRIFNCIFKERKGQDEILLPVHIGYPDMLEIRDPTSIGNQNLRTQLWNLSEDVSKAKNASRFTQGPHAASIWIQTPVFDDLPSFKDSYFF